MTETIQPRRTYGRRSKPLGVVRKAAIQKLPDYEIKLEGVKPASITREKLCSSLTPSAKRLHLEIGFGTGEHPAAMAAANPGDLFLAAEPYVAGLANLMRMITEQNITNLRLYPYDGLAVLRALAPATLDCAYLLFPDPWPKNRHHDRRFIQTETVAEFARVIRPGGSLLLASDDPPLAAWMLKYASACPDFTRQSPSPYEPKTRYAAKAIAAGRTPQYLYFIRK